MRFGISGALGTWFRVIGLNDERPTDESAFGMPTHPDTVTRILTFVAWRVDKGAFVPPSLWTHSTKFTYHHSFNSE